MSGRIGSLFSGYEGLGMGVQAAMGGEIAWVSDVDPGACKILAHRYPGVPNIGDITKVAWDEVEPVDVLTGGFPCQDVSAAGKRLGMKPGTRSGLWSHMAYAIDQLRPSLVVAENVRGLLSASAHSELEPCPWCVGDDEGVHLRALGGVLGDLAGLGYDASWHGLRAADVGAPHGRFRVFVVAWPAADAQRSRRERGWARQQRWTPENAPRNGARAPVADTAGDGRDEGCPQRAAQGPRQRGRAPAGRRGTAAAAARRDGGCVVTSPVPDALRTQLAEALPHEPWCHHDMDCCGCTCLDDRLLAVGPLLPVVERIAAAARAEGAAEALREVETWAQEAADDRLHPSPVCVGERSGLLMTVFHVRARPAALSAHTTEGDPT